MQRRQKEIGLLLSKNIWIEKTHLPLFLGDIQMIEELKREIAAAVSDAEKLDGEIKKELAKHPQYKNGASLHKKASTQRKNLSHCVRTSFPLRKRLMRRRKDPECPR